MAQQPRWQWRLGKAGYKIERDVKGQYIDGILRLFGGIDQLGWTRNAAIMRVLSNAQVRKGQAYTYSQLVQLGQPKDKIEDFQNVLAEFARCGALLRGYRLTCSYCQLDAWYRLDDVVEATPCQGCYSLIQPPLDSSFAYQVNPLLSLGLRSGVLTVLSILDKQDETTEWHNGFIIQKGDLNTDVDLVIERNGHVFFNECKDNFKTDPASIQALCNQLKTLQQIAIDAGAKLVFATLVEPPLPEALQSFLDAQNIPALTAQDLSLELG